MNVLRPNDLPDDAPLGAPGPGLEHLTDAGNAQRLVRLHGEDLRFCHPQRRWYVWTGNVWAVDDTGEVSRRAKQTVSSMYAEASRAPKAEIRMAIADHAKQTESARRLAAMIELARSEPGIPIMPDEFDSDPWAFNVANGTIDLRTAELHRHRREDLITKLAPVEYDPNAEAPTWETDFLMRVLPDPKVRGFVQRAAGYSLTGSTKEQVLFIAWGDGANGKSTFMEAARGSCGGYGLHTPADTLLARRDTGIPNDIARLRGARFVSAVETGEGQRLNEVQVKMLTGGDMIAARHMRAEWFEFRPVAKLWLLTNYRPAVRGTDLAIWRRIRLIPFTVTIPENERDHDLPEKLLAELSGILNWAVKGCLEWQREGLAAPQAVLAATEEYRADQDVLGTFLNDCCVRDPSRFAAASDLYAAYRDWSEEAGERALTQKAWGARMTERGFERRKHGAGNRVHWFGLGLLCDREDPR